MLGSWLCQSCCSNCTISPPPSTILESPFALRNLLGIGTITLGLPVEKQHQVCDHTHAEDGWHPFKAEALSPFFSNVEDLACSHELDYLQKQHFISATYNCMTRNGDRIVVRIYLIPFDLGGLKGALRIRKDAVLNPARRYLRKLLPRISRNVDMWFQSPEHLTLSENEGLFLPYGKDSHTLSEIYTDLPSPNPMPVEGCGGISGRLLDQSDKLDGLGMRSILYPYQRRTVAAMLQNELNTTTIPDPLYIPLKTMNDKTFYFQPGSMEILSEPQETARSRGGILCEELGTGKTVMVLSLIMATRTQISDAEPHIVDTRRVMTPLAFRHFPSGDYAIARKRYVREPQKRKGVPSLVELMVHQARVTPESSIPASSSSKHYLQEIDNVLPPSLGRLLRSNNPFYFHHLVEPSNRERNQRHAKDKWPKTMYLTSATIIVVPPNLLSQWDREIHKHCDIPLRVLILRAKTPMPSVQSLATDYDIILMTYTRFTSEANNNDISKLHTNRMCSCPEIDGSRVPECNCQVTSISPFLQIRWKRLVIDEGHVSSSLTTTLVPFSQLLSVERRWIVTGTPTTNLLGLSLGSKTIEELQTSPSTDSTSDSSAPAFFPENILEADVRMEDVEQVQTESQEISPDVPSRIRIWNKYDREDLNKLSNMITHFISVPQFKADPKLIMTHVIEPLLDPQGPRPGAIQVLNQVMEMVMIRHRIEDVEKDVVLPPVSQESVLLDLDPYMIKSYNALQAIIVINAIDSQRTDQDYMFHPRNADSLQDTVRNMSQICFWHIDDHLYNAQELVSNSEKIVQRAKERKMADVDIMLLNEALEHLRKAIEDPLWKLMQRHEDVPYRVFDMNQRIYQTWSRTDGLEPDSAPNQTGFLHADRLLRLHEMVIKKPLANEDKLIELGEVIAHRDIVFRKAYEEAQRRKNKGRKKTRGVNDDISSESRMADNFAKKASASDTLKEMQRVLELTLKKEMEDDNEAPSNLSPDEQRPSALLASSPVSSLHVGSSASSKLNYIINEVQKYSPTEKFLIFSESPLTLAHVAEGLELIKVKFLRFTTQINPQSREQLVLTFETSETFRVFLMELKHGARGLNLISASRVIFCEPVWQADVESQAIKRAHRIGQTRPIKVKTLAIRGTAEANMVTRRIILKNSQEKLPKVIEEAGMRHFIANPKFLTLKPHPTPIKPFPLIRLPPEFVAPRPQSLALKLRIPPLKNASSPSKVVRVEDPITEGSPSPTSVEKMSGLSPKKRIRFASPSGDVGDEEIPGPPAKKKIRFATP